MRTYLLACLSCLGVVIGYAQDTAFTPFVATKGYDSSTVLFDLVSLCRDNARVTLDWQSSMPGGIDFFTIERSCNGGAFEVVSVIKQPEADPIQGWTDDAPAKGRNLYRIRCTMKDGQSFFSKTVSAHVAGDISFKFYPNPVDHILIISSESPVDVQILDASGKARIQQSQLQGLQLINVSALEKGIYLLRIQNRQSNSIKQEKLLKN
jgi:Secretion system C-terminal sorting domain